MNQKNQHSCPVSRRAGIPFGVMIARYRKCSVTKKRKKKPNRSKDLKSTSTTSVSKEPPARKVFYENSFNPSSRAARRMWLPASFRQARGISIRRSKRWIDTTPVVRQWYDLPLINRLGQFTGQSAHTLQCGPADVFSTTVATIVSRLKRQASRFNDKHVVSANLRVLLRAAVYYALSRNSYFMDRVLYLLRYLRSNGATIHKLTIKFLSKCDANKRFVYSQACYQANWLLFRVCRPRDKSHFKFKASLAHPEGWSHWNRYDVRAQVTNLLCGERYTVPE
jgi:hypothetical protein